MSASVLLHGPVVLYYRFATQLYLEISCEVSVIRL